MLEHGLQTAPDGRVRFPPEVVERAIATTPRGFTFYAREGEPYTELGGDRVHFVPGSSGLSILDHRTNHVRLANSTEYGLVSYVFTQDLARGHRLIDRLATGMMGLNTGLVSNAAAPFGGVKQSGIGREGGLEGIHEYLDTKYTLIPVS